MVSIRLKNIISRIRSNILHILVLLCILYVSFHFYKTLLTSPHILSINNTSLTNKTKYYDYYLRSINENNDTQISPYYRHATSDRNSSYPYISGDTFRAFSDYIYDETRHDNLISVKYGDIVFVKTDYLSEFFNSPFNSIQNPFVLVTHNSDLSAPNKYRTYLSNPKILMWYASNPTERNHQKLSPIPIGLANTRWPQGNLDKFMYALKTHRKSWSQRTSLLYVNFDVKTSRTQREKALSQALTIENAQIIKKRITFETYLQQIGNAKFVLSPPGNGLDCHRTWEAILMGAVPIVLSSELDSLYSRTRSVIIDDWLKLTQNFLLSLDFSLNDHHLPDVLYAHYWHKTLFSHRNNQSEISV